jgi:hypothetical protein
MKLEGIEVLYALFHMISGYPLKKNRKYSDCYSNRNGEKMLNRQIEKSYIEVENLECCHHDDRECSCYECLTKDFRQRADEYNCIKKLHTYVAKYAASFTSEIYNYLQQSGIIDPFANRKLRVLSLGCGFSPDYYAMIQYIDDKKLKTTLEYMGIDNTLEWNSVRILHPNLSIETSDLLNPFRINGYDIIFLCKMFSTIFKHNQHEIFLENLKTAIDLAADESFVLVFNDVNTDKMGRDLFDYNISCKLPKVRRFFTSSSKYSRANWQVLPNDMVFPVVMSNKYNPLNEIRNYVYFEYRK